MDSVTLDILYAGLSIVFEADRRSDEEYVNLAKARLMAVELQEEWCQRLQRIIDECPEDQKDRVSLLYGVMLLHYKQALEFDDWGTVKSKIADVHRRWHQADPSPRNSARACCDGSSYAGCRYTQYARYQGHQHRRPPDNNPCHTMYSARRDRFGGKGLPQIRVDYWQYYHCAGRSYDHSVGHQVRSGR